MVNCKELKSQLVVTEAGKSSRYRGKGKGLLMRILYRTLLWINNTFI